MSSTGAETNCDPASRKDTDDMTPEALLKMGMPSWEAHELDIAAITDERLDDMVPDEDVLNMAVSGQLQAVSVRPNGNRVEVVDGRQRVKRVMVINALCGRKAYTGDLASVHGAIARLKDSDIGRRIVELRPRGMKVLVTAHRGDEREARRDSVVANNYRADDPVERKVRTAKRMAGEGSDVEEIAGAFKVSKATAKRWLAKDLAAPKRKRGKTSSAPTRAKLGVYVAKLAKDDTETARPWRVMFGWLTGKPIGDRVYTRADVIGEWPELGQYIGGR